MRLFVALDLPDTILETLSALAERLRPAAAIQWSVVSNLHVTTKFIGEWPDERLGALTAALRTVKTGPVAVRIEGLGWFPNPHSPRVFWAGVKSEENRLSTLAKATDEAAASAGVTPETRDFHPHLTLARIKTAVNLAPLRQAVAQLEQTDFGAFEARSQYLYLSKNSIYTKLEEFPL